MALKVYNSLSRQKEEFKTVVDGKVKMYVCGITAYDSCHLGHARAAVAFDIVYRYLRFIGLDVTYVRNFTDIDDKIIARSNERKIPWKKLTEQYITEYHEDMKNLNVLTPTMEPKATEHVSAMIVLIEKLMAAGKAYESNGSVYFSVREFKNYGKLSQKKIEDLESGARIEIDETKKDPLDFALWKKAKPGEPFWASPWGEGRPGWHIECSVMSTQYLGQPFDIHGGGRDLIFPHHENEVAQSEGADGHHFCNYFLHNGFVNIDAEKMSKSLGNFFTIKDVVAKHDPEVVRYFLISSHYGSPIDYTENNINEAAAQLNRYYQFEERLEEIPVETDTKLPSKLSELETELQRGLENFQKNFQDAMDDDFNTPRALGVLFETIRSFNRFLDSGRMYKTPFAKWALKEWQRCREVLQVVFGILQMTPAVYFKRIKMIKIREKKIDVAWVEAKIMERLESRKSKDFPRSDTLRNELSQQGIILKDRPDGSTDWEIA